ncbi:MAG: cell division protein FtsZ [Pseudomonadota bacterium]|nr:cell division protein FtsZ [Pseudomonadota bacterium]
MSSFKLVDTDMPDDNGQARFTVFGVGGGGSNAVDHMVRTGINGVRFVCANTDKQALDRMSAPSRIQLGVQSTRGLGAGANPEVGRQAAEEEREQLLQALEGADMVFVTAGMGGGTGTGAAPVIAELAKELGILTVGVVTTPFLLEGRRRMKSAERGIAALAEHVDSLIIIPNEKLLTVYGDISMVDAYKKADDVLLNAVRSIFDLIVNHGRINLDFADLKTAMSTRGYAMMGIGSARGDDRARQATEMAIRSPLLDNILLENAKGVLVNITAGEDIKGSEIQMISDVVSQIADMDEGDIFYGTVIDPEARDELRVTVIATGLTRDENGVMSGSRQPVRAAPNVAQPSVSAATPSDDDDVPAISRRSQPAAAATPASRPAAEKPATISIQDFLKNHQKR